MILLRFKLLRAPRKIANFVRQSQVQASCRNASDCMASIDPGIFRGALNVDSRANVFSVGQSKVFSASLDSGIWYKLGVTGEWTPDYKSDVYTPLESYQLDPTLLLRNSQVPWRVDAKFITLDSWSNASDYPWGYDDFGLFSSILGADDDNFWGSYSPTHAY